MLYGTFAFDYPRPEINDHLLEQNLALITTRQTKENFSVFVTALPAGQHKLATPYDGSYLSPLYLYPTTDPNKRGLFDQEENRRANLADGFVAAVAGKTGLKWVADGKGDLAATFGPEDVFNYIYAIFHAPSYRQRYAEFLKIDFPRVPLTGQVELFGGLVGLGGELVRLHLLDGVSGGAANPFKFPTDGDNKVEQVRYQEPQEGRAGRVAINAQQYFDNVPPEIWEFQVGGYQVLQKWLKDRKGRTLTNDDITHYKKIVAALTATQAKMAEIDRLIENSGGWPLR